uniref:Uncharacterized protein n=1 Tax=Anguilla anguilla TaxID=7936 RepID=A0A0E9UN29_ANGAN
MFQLKLSLKLRFLWKCDEKLPLSHIFLHNLPVVSQTIL